MRPAIEGRLSKTTGARSIIQECPGVGRPCGVAIRKDQDLCGPCRQERRANAPPAPCPGPPRGDIAPEIPASTDTGAGRVVHWRRVMPCGRLGKLAPIMTDDTVAVTCGRCLKRLAQQPPAALKPARPEPPADPRPRQPVAVPDTALTLVQRRTLQETDEAIRALRGLGRRSTDDTLRIDIRHYDTVRALLRRVTGV